MKRIFFLILISALLMCNGCNIFKENIISTEIDKTEQDTTDSKYQTLDTDLLDREFLEVGGIELLELGMNEYLSRYTSSEGTFTISGADVTNDFPEELVATVYKGNIIKNLIMDCQSYAKYRPNETTGGIFVSWRRKEELPTGA